MKRIALAYSGGAATTAAIPWLIERFGAEIVTVTLDLGQGTELAAVRERALAAGAVRAHVIDAREELVRDFVQPAIQAGAFTTPAVWLVPALTRPLIAKRVVDVARMESAGAVAHGGRPGTPLEPALHESLRTVSAGVEVVAVPGGPGTPADARAVDANVAGRLLSVPDAEAPDDLYLLTRHPDEGPDVPAIIDIEFAAGVPVRTNGVEMPPLEMIESLETIAGAHGVGRILDLAEGPSAYALEAPAAVVLQAAHEALQEASLGADLTAHARALGRVYASTILSGRWFSELREGIDAFVRLLQPRLSGTVRITLHKGQCTVTGVRAGDTRTAGDPKAVA